MKIMNEFRQKIAHGFLLKYISGFVFAVICFVAVAFICAVYTTITMPGSCIGVVGIFFAIGILAGIPTGAVLGIFLVDRYILEAAVLKQQVIIGFLAGLAASAFLVFLIFLLNYLESYLLITPKDNPIIGEIVLFIFFSVFFIGVLAALLGYTRAGSTKRKKAQKAS
jgi:hypothetical protein